MEYILRKKDGIHKIGEDNYMGSGIALITAQEKYGIENFEKTIVKTFSTRDEARLEERIIVNEELIKDSSCYNIVLGGGGIGNPGLIIVNYRDEKLREDKFFLIPIEEYYNNKDRYITPCDDKLVVLRRRDNKYVSITKEEYERNSNLYSTLVSVNYKDESKRENKYFLVTTNEYYNNRDIYITTSFEKGVYKNVNNSSDVRQLSTNDPLVLSGQFIGIMSGVKQSQETIQKKLGNKNGSFGSFWITDGIENKRIKSTSIPDGWWKGRTQVGYSKYTNLKTSEEKVFSDNDYIPENFIKSKFIKNGKIIPYEEITTKIDELHNIKKVAKFYNMKDKTLKELLKYYENINNNKKEEEWVL